jgi:hypothetical protein
MAAGLATCRGCYIATALVTWPLGFAAKMDAPLHLAFFPGDCSHARIKA